MNLNWRVCFCASGTHLPRKNAIRSTGSHCRRIGEKSVSPVRRPSWLPASAFAGAGAGAAGSATSALTGQPAVGRSRAAPDLLALGSAPGVAGRREAVVVLELEVRELHPDAGDEERVGVRREAAVGLDEV